MNANDVRKYVNKKVYIILKNNFRYTLIIPDFSGDSFCAKDKFGHSIDIDCDMVGFIQEVPE